MVAVKIPLDDMRARAPSCFALDYGSRTPIHESLEDQLAVGSRRPLVSLTRLCCGQPDDFAEQHVSVRIRSSTS